MIFYDLTLDYDKNTASRLLQKNNDFISAEEIRDIYAKIRHVDRATVELANSIASEAGYFLSVYEIEALVKADISDSEAAKIVAERRAYVSRLSSLIIPIVSFFAIGEDRVVWLATSIDESAHAYWQVVRRERKDKKRRQLVCRMKRISVLCQEMLDHFQDIPPSISEDFHEFREAFLKSAYNSENAGGGIRSFRRDLELLYACSEVSIIRAKNNLSDFWVADNGGKRHIVESAYEMCYSFNGPKFVTTPNSEFAQLCGLLYELATGNCDEGFAGAINTFAKSEEKKLWDKSDLQASQQSDRPSDDEDNFFENKEQIREILDRYEKYKKIADLGFNNRIVQSFIFIVFRDLIDRAKSIQDRYGPNLIWASRMKLSHDPDSLKDSRELLFRARQTAIELGNARRAQSS